MKIDIKKIWNKHFGIEEEQQVDTTLRGFKIDGDDIKKIVRAAIFDSKTVYFS